MFKLQHIINGFYPFELGTFDDVQNAVDAIKEHVRVNSAITNPIYSKSVRGNSIRIDYGAKDCYYLIILNKADKAELAQLDDVREEVDWNS